MVIYYIYPYLISMIAIEYYQSLDDSKNDVCFTSYHVVQ